MPATSRSAFIQIVVIPPATQPPMQTGRQLGPLVLRACPPGAGRLTRTTSGEPVWWLVIFALCGDPWPAHLIPLADLDTCLRAALTVERDIRAEFDWLRAICRPGPYVDVECAPSGWGGP